MNEPAFEPQAPLSGPLEIVAPEWCSREIDQISAALAAAQAEMGGIPLDAENPFFKKRYASLGAVISQTKEHLGKHGLCIIQTPTLQGELIGVHTRLLHKSGQWIDGGVLMATLAEEKGRSAVQAAGSFITYMRRYSRMALLQLYGDEDTDGQDVNTRRPRQTAREPAQQAQQPAPKAQETKDANSKAKWDKIRLKLLNRLNAAPGQMAREFVKSYLLQRGWISPTQEPEDWPTQHIPLTEDAAAELFSNIQLFERRQNEETIQQ